MGVTAPIGVVKAIKRIWGSSKILGKNRPIRVALEPIRWYPKDGDLHPFRSKPGETLVEDQTEIDVQIVRVKWV